MKIAACMVLEGGPYPVHRIKLISEKARNKMKDCTQLVKKKKSRDISPEFSTPRGL